MKRKNLICLLLAASLCLSATSCGTKDTVVDEYGIEESGTKVSTSTDIVVINTGGTGSLQEIFGETVTYQHDFNFGDTEVNVNVNAYCNIPDLEGMNVYNVKPVSDGLNDEDSIIKSLFGDTAKKLEKITYSNESDYTSLLYKYREIRDQHDLYKCYLNGEFPDNDQPDRSIINLNNAEEYRWLDGTDMYIHMYEGKYKSVDFVLLLAYDEISRTRYIFFDPKNIEEYIPGYDAKTVLISRTHKPEDGEVETENACKDNTDELKEDALNLLNDSFKLNGKYSITDNSYSYETYSADYITSIYADDLVSIKASEYDDYTSELYFSNQDFISTIEAPPAGNPLNYKIIANQRDLLEEYKIEHENPNETLNEFMPSEACSKMLEKVNYNLDGYAFYIQGLKSGTDLDVGGTISALEMNNGIIKYTSRGLYGVDLELTSTVEDTVENVRLLDFETLTKSFETQLKEQLDLNKICKPSSLSINRINLDYRTKFEITDLESLNTETDSASYTDSEEIFTFIPVWQFGIEVASMPSAVVEVNAMDGSILNITYFSYD